MEDQNGPVYIRVRRQEFAKHMEMSSTLREIQSAIDPRVLALLAIAAVFLAVTGPFGTFDVLNLPARLLYWSGVVFVSYGLRYLADMVARRVGLRGWTQRIVAASGFALVLSVAIVVANYLIFGLAISVGAVVTTFMIVVIVSVLIEGVIQLLGGAEDDVAAESGFAKFMQRLPLETHYFEAYNRDNVHLVDITESPRCTYHCDGNSNYLRSPRSRPHRIRHRL